MDEPMQILRNAMVVDGTGAPARPADVVLEGGRIFDVTDPGVASGTEVHDLDGLVLAPGFIDCHTHYDAQVLWDRDLTPSAWHGVTTVVLGNCGFGIAPTRPEHRETIARTLENVEGMSLDALIAGIPWTFESFPEYLDAVARGGTRLNVAAMIGHTPLRLYVMGDEATERAATDREVAEMRRLVGEALDAGAIGFASSKADVHAGAYGKPVPSRLAARDEIMEIAKALGERRRGTLAITIGADFAQREMAELSQRIQRPVTWTALVAGPGAAEQVDRHRALDGEVWPQVSCRPIVMQLTLADPGPLTRAPAFAEILGVPRDRRAALIADPAWRSRARTDTDTLGWPAYDRVTVQETRLHHDLAGGPSLAELAVRSGQHPLDVMCDISLDDGLMTRFGVVLANDDPEVLAGLLQDEQMLLGLSDAGAHASQLCDAVFSTYLLEHWVRETGVLSLEKAVWRLTGHPAAVFRLPGRGVIAPGTCADLVAFDPATVGVEEMQRVFDLPAGADRLVAQSRGIEAVWVNGTPIRMDNKDLDSVLPGMVLRESVS